MAGHGRLQKRKRFSPLPGKSLAADAYHRPPPPISKKEKGRPGFVSPDSCSDRDSAGLFQQHALFDRSATAPVASTLAAYAGLFGTHRMDAS